MTSSLLLMGLLGMMSPVQDAKLELVVPGVTLRTIGAEIGKQMGLEVTVDPAVANEVLVIRTTGQTAAETFQRIEREAGAKFVMSENRLSILPDFAVRNGVLAEINSEFVKKVRESKKRYLEYAVKRREKDGESGEFIDYDPTIQQVVMADFLRGVPEQVLTGIKPNERIVFSTNPTQMQRPLGRVDGTKIAKWIAEENEGRNYSPEQLKEMQGDDPFYLQMLELMGKSPEDFLPKKITEEPAKVIVVLRRFGSRPSPYDGVSLSYQVLGRTGRPLLSTEAYLGSDEEMVYAEGVPMAASAVPEMAGSQEPEEPEFKAEPGDDLKLSYSPEAVAVRKAEKVDYEAMAQGDMPPQVKAMLIAVDQFEPARFEYGEAILDAAKKLNRSVVACVPDPQGYAGEAPKTVGELRQQLANMGWELSTKGSEWLVAAERSSTWFDRLDRPSFAQLLRHMETRTFLPLDTIAEFAYKNPRAVENSLYVRRTNQFAPQLMTFEFGAGDSNAMLRLWGSLNAGERARLKQSGRISLGALGSGSRAVLTDLFFSASGRIDRVKLDTVLAPHSSKTMMENMMGGMDFGEMSSAQLEPTELLPIGLPAQGFLALGLEKSQYVLAVNDKNRPVPGMPPVGRSELVMLRLMMKNPEAMAQMQDYQAMLENLRSGMQESLKLAVIVGSDLGQYGVLNDVGEPDMATKYGLSRLPSPLKEKLDADVAEVEKSPLGMFFQMMSGFRGNNGPIKP